ncbi:hypothetical protein COLO4_35543 [Corchorus olitorius]|uniref:Uncharacterized protein n=1 Tax=Corchorus olitorius TaxID=93759 RepID=A0A1R3GFJ4_9ROSI|nr:hypothetical protein COLO4_35543 [Corchorus olitorius]
MDFEHPTICLNDHEEMACLYDSPRSNSSSINDVESSSNMTIGLDKKLVEVSGSV